MKTRTWTMAAAILGATLLSPAAAGDGAAEDTRAALDLARRAARFVARQAQPTEDGRGVRFPEYAEEPEKAPDTLYAGTAGVLVFLENAAAILGDADLAALADRAAAGLAARLKDGDDAAETGLYTGLAGIGAAFLVRHRVRGGDEALAVARGVGDRLVARQKVAGRLGSWDDVHDVIAGAAGTLLFLVDLAETTGDAGYRDAALRGGRWLAAEGEVEAGPGGAARWWTSDAGAARHYPNFSHGTAGVAYALARIAALTGDADCRRAAEEGAAWLLRHATREAATLALPHYLPGAEDRFREGWCHGPAGTARLFLILAEVTGSATWLEHARAGAAWILREKPVTAVRDGSARFYAPSLCCGAAGVLDLFVDLYRVTGEASYREYAAAVGSYLGRLAKVEGDGVRWTNYDRPDEKGVTYHGVSLMLGASGEGLALLRLATIDHTPDPVAALPDHRVPAGGPPLLATDVATPAHGADGSAYVVLVAGSAADDPYVQAARALAAWRGGTVVEGFDPAQPEQVLPRLKVLGARFVALVLPPASIDTNTQRRFLMAAARLDDDIFVDVAYGFLTGTPRTPPLALVERAKRLEAQGLARRWTAAGVASSIQSTVYEGAGDPTALRAGYEGRHVYFGSRETDPDVRNAVERFIAEVKGGGVLSLSGCGDPEGTWLFSDRRNADSSKHWPFNPAKVGQDPEGEMPRFTAAEFGRMHLDDTVVLTGVCHAGSLDRVYVEGDIVATFGTVEHPVPYRIPDGRSVAGAVLDAGAAAYVAPLGPNHGYRGLVETQEALEKRLPLGDMVRSTWNDVAMSQARAPVLDLYLPEGNVVDRDPGEVMGGGGANRVLYGDPALAPFAKEVVEPAVAVTVAPGPSPGAFVVEAAVRHKDWWAWDMFARDRNGERIRLVVPLPREAPGRLRVTAEAFGADGKRIDVKRLDAHVEWIDGARRIHLQVAGPRGGGLDAVGARARFRLGPATP